MFAYVMCVWWVRVRCSKLDPLASMGWLWVAWALLAVAPAPIEPEARYGPAGWGRAVRLERGDDQQKVIPRRAHAAGFRNPRFRQCAINETLSFVNAHGNETRRTERAGRAAPNLAHNAPQTTGKPPPVKRRVRAESSGREGGTSFVQCRLVDRHR